MAEKGLGKKNNFRTARLLSAEAKTGAMGELGKNTLTKWQRSKAEGEYEHTRHSSSGAASRSALARWVICPSPSLRGLQVVLHLLGGSSAPHPLFGVCKSFCTCSVGHLPLTLSAGGFAATTAVSFKTRKLQQATTLWNIPSASSDSSSSSSSLDFLLESDRHLRTSWEAKRWKYPREKSSLSSSSSSSSSISNVGSNLGIGLSESESSKGSSKTSVVSEMVSVTTLLLWCLRFRTLLLRWRIGFYLREKEAFYLR